MLTDIRSACLSLGAFPFISQGLISSLALAQRVLSVERLVSFGQSGEGEEDQTTR